MSDWCVHPTPESAPSPLSVQPPFSILQIFFPHVLYLSRGVPSRGGVLQAAADAKRMEENEKQMEKIRQMNNRVSEAEKKRDQMEGYDISKTEAKLQSAEERKAALIKETQDKASAEIAKVLHVDFSQICHVSYYKSLSALVIRACNTQNRDWSQVYSHRTILHSTLRERAESFAEWRPTAISPPVFQVRHNRTPPFIE